MKGPPNKRKIVQLPRHSGGSIRVKHLDADWASAYILLGQEFGVRLMGHIQSIERIWYVNFFTV